MELDRVGAVITPLAFGVGFTFITFVLYEAARIVPWLVLPVVGPAEGRLVIMAAGSLVAGVLFFSSPALWVRMWVLTAAGTHTQSLMSDPSWLISAYVVGPFFIYGSIHGLFVTRGLTWPQMAKAVARRYIATVLAVGVVGLLMGLVTIARSGK